MKGEKELLGININELGRDAAAIKVVARMFDLKFDTLWQRYEREKKRKRWMLICGVLLFAFVSLGIGVYIAHQNTILKEKDLKMMVNQARFVTEKANKLIDEGDSYTARRIALEILPHDINNPKHIKPFVIEAADMLYSAFIRNDAVLRGHNDEVRLATFSNDGKWVFSVSLDGSMRTWDVKTGITVDSLDFVYWGRPILYASYNRNGDYIVLSSGNKIKIRNVKTGKLYSGGYHYVSNHHSVTISPDNSTILLPSEDGLIRIMETKTLTYKNIIKGHTAAVFHVDYSPDGILIASASADKSIRIWNSQTGNQICKPFLGHTDTIFYVKFSPDGKLLASVSKDRTIRVWDVKTGRMIGTPFIGHSDAVLSVCFSPDGKHLASASRDKTVKIWNLREEMQGVTTLKGHTGIVFSVNYNKEGSRLVSASADNTIRMWDLKPNTECPILHKSFRRPIKSIALSPNGQMIAVSTVDSLLGMYNVNDGSEIDMPLKGHFDQINNVEFSQDGYFLVTASNDNNARIWNIKEKKIGPVLYGHSNDVNYASFSNNGKYVVTASKDNTARLWNTEKGEQIGNWLYCGNGRPVSCAAFSHKGDRIVTVSYNIAEVWDVKKRKKKLILFGHAKDINSVSFSPDDKYIVTASSDKTIILWNSKSGKQIFPALRGHTSSVIAEFSHDGRSIISLSLDNKIKIWDVATGKERGVQYEGAKTRSSYMSLSISKNGNRIAASFDSSLMIWDVPSPKQLIDKALKQFKGYRLTPEEKRKYYLE